MSRDIIAEILSGSITQQEAECIFDSWLETADGFPDDLGLARQEYTAFCHGADFGTIALWRKQGWPKRCELCGGSLGSPEEYGWFVWDKATRKTGNYGGRLGLVHIPCLPQQGNENDA